MRNKFKVNTSLNIVEYVAVVENIASEYFDERGEYTPHFGRLNAMRVFYNTCIVGDIANVPHGITDALQMQDLVTNADFVFAFYNAIDSCAAKLSFANAYSDALSIVEVKKSSADKIVGAIKAIILDLVNAIAETISGENLDKFGELAKEISAGKLSEQNIINAFGNSDVFKKILQKE